MFSTATNVVTDTAFPAATCRPVPGVFETVFSDVALPTPARGTVPGVLEPVFSNKGGDEEEDEGAKVGSEHGRDVWRLAEVVVN